MAPRETPKLEKNKGERQPITTNTPEKTMSKTPVKSKPLESKAQSARKAISKPIPGSVTKSAKKSWKRRPKPAHSGVPVPEKMKKLLGKKLLDGDCSF